MAGRVISLIVTEGQRRRAATLASELQELISGISGHVSDLAEILMAVAYAQYEACEFEQALHTTDQLRKLAAGAAAAELGPATVMSGAMKILTGNRAAGVRDLDAGVQVARASAPAMLAFCAGYKTDLVILGFDLADDVLAAETREALSAAESSSHAYGRAVARWACGSVLVRRGGSDRQAGITLLQQSRFDDLDPGGSLVDAELAEVLRQDGHGGAMIEALQSALLGEVEDGDALFGGYSLAVLVRLLVGRRAPNDLVQAGEIVTKVEKILAPVRQPALDLWPLYCRTVLADADGDAALFAETLSQYRSLAAGLDAHGHRILADQLAGASTDVTWSRARGCV